MKYFIRSLKYFVALCVICVAILALMLATGTSALTLDQTVYVMFHTSRYATLFAAIVVLAALYPKFGFVVRKVKATWRRTANRSSTPSNRQAFRFAPTRTA